jgi:hypothetical protein
MYFFSALLLNSSNLLRFTPPLLLTGYEVYIILRCSTQGNVVFENLIVTKLVKKSCFFLNFEIMIKYLKIKHIKTTAASLSRFVRCVLTAALPTISLFGAELYERMKIHSESKTWGGSSSLLQDDSSVLMKSLVLWDIILC